MTARDLVYGRQGGRVVSGDRTLIDPATCPRCTTCGQPMVLGQRGEHVICAERDGREHAQAVYPKAKP